VSEPAQQKTYLISLFAQHRVAANLLMVIMLLAGTMSLMRMNTQFFPTFAVDFVTVRVDWRGASAEDVEDAISTPVEQALRTVDYVKNLDSTSAYGRSYVVLEFDEGTDMGQALDQVKERVTQMRNLPTDSETPDIKSITNYEPIAKLLITTDHELEELRYFAHRVEDELLARGISSIRIRGLPEEEIAIQLRPADLASLGLDLAAVGQQVANFSRDLPAGEVGQQGNARQLRSLEQRRDEKSFASLPIKTDQAGNLVLLGDVADISQRAKKNQVTVFYEGKPAVELALQRTENSDSLEAAKILQTWLVQQEGNLPAGVSLHVYDEKWALIKGRINLLLKNGLGGLLLVITILLIFLHGRVAWWVTVGIPVSFMGALAVMYLAGGSINMLSLFGLIIALGIIVDDAIVVGEDGLTHYQQGENALQAAEGGARRMVVPVLASSLTTIASFLPLMMVGGIMGSILFDIPFVVICVIIASLIESFLILPGHLRHAFHKMHHTKPARFRALLDDGFNSFRDKLFRPVVTLAVSFRWITISLALASLILAVGLIKGERLPFTFFTSPEGTEITASVRFLAGTPSTTVASFLTELNTSLLETEKYFLENSEDEDDLIEVVVTRSGSVREGDQNSRVGDEFGTIQVELSSPDERSVRNKAFIKAWLERIELPAGLDSLSIVEPGVGPPGRDLDIKLTGASAATLKQAAESVAEALKQFTGVSAVADNMPYGQEQLIYHLTGQAKSLGLTVNSVGQQLRAAFDGQLVQIFQQGDDEIEVRVMLPDKERNTQATLADMLVKLPNGNHAPLTNIVTFEAQRGFDVLRHSEGKLAVHIVGTVDAEINNNDVVIDDLKQNWVPKWEAKYGVTVKFEGRAEEQGEAMADMEQGIVIAFILIYLVLAWVFASYGLPLVVMAVIPFGLVGALVGHFLLGIDLTILSLFGIFGLSGIVVNDSIILVTFFKQLREQGVAMQEAIIQAACQRLRAVLLTSLTTIAGLTPLLFETSVQAKFLIPMAVSISFGLMFATILVLLLVPALLSVQSSVASFISSKE